MEKYYTDERNVQILVALLKAHGIKKAILSPGSANSPFVASLQYDEYFETYSCVDERSAAYIACGLAEESGEPVILSCTGATASRNYLPGVTEAFYRKLPVLAITSTQPVYRVGHLVAQVVDRSTQPNDAYTLCTTLPIIKDDQDKLECEVKVNEAILQLTSSSGGSVNINLQTSSQRTYNTRELPQVRVIKRWNYLDSLPSLDGCKVAVFVGSHLKWKKADTEALDTFCASNNAVVFCDHTSGYRGAYRVRAALIGCQEFMDHDYLKPDIMIHIGEVSGDYYGLRMAKSEVWRVSPDGNIRDTFGKLTNVFEMHERHFFERYSTSESVSNDYLQECQSLLEDLAENIPDLPFSNLWTASKLSPALPKNCILHFGILNSLRSWNFFDVDSSISTACNVGGFGIDGNLSSALGASLVDVNRITYCVLGDLAFFYDMNSLGNRHVGNNLRILLINNGRGTEFRTYKHHTSHFGDLADKFISAQGHFGQQSPTLVKNYAESLGFEYFAASNKEEFMNHFAKFTDAKASERPIVFEVFTDSDDECKAQELMMNLKADQSLKTKQAVKNLGKKILGGTTASFAKKLFGK
jgi:2-succinyl-5-enolpyruvyl-6-hydroxy-3-cyclohexene-1-carboxylate synthase